jgi:hypothetical protein
MSWMAAVPIVTAGLGYLDGERKREETKRQNMAQAEISRYSPWTGQMGQITPNHYNGMSSAIQGGLSGFGAVQGMMGGEKASPQPAVSESLPAQSSAASPGGQAFEDFQSYKPFSNRSRYASYSRS